MKSQKLIYACLTFVLIALAAQAQIPNLAQPGMNAAMTKLFGNITGFSAKASVRMLDKESKETMSMGMNFALLEGKIRLEVDMTQIKSKDLTPEMITPLKQMGMDKMISIVRPDKKATLVIYPALQAYAEIPLSSEDAADLEKSFKIEKSPLGKETLDGHPCEKSKVNVVDTKGGRQEAVVWNATDLKEFPVQMQMNQPEATVVMRYREIQLIRPEPKLFEAPEGYSKYDSMEKLMQSAMLKMIGGK
jgi:hypothetical protein